MADLSDFKRGQIVVARMADTRVIKPAKLFSVARTVSKVMAAFEKERKISSLKQNFGRRRKLSDRDRRTVAQIVRKDHKNTVPKIIVKLNDHLENTVSSKIVRRRLHKTGFHGGGLQSENEMKINLFEISRCFRYFVYPLYIYIYIYICVCVCVCVNWTRFWSNTNILLVHDSVTNYYFLTIT